MERDKPPATERVYRVRERGNQFFFFWGGGCSESVLLYMGFLELQRVGAPLVSVWLLLLQIMGSRAVGSVAVAHRRQQLLSMGLVP